MSAVDRPPREAVAATAGSAPWLLLPARLIIRPMPSSSDGIARLPRSVIARQLARMRAALRHGNLDAALAVGQDPWSAADLMVRASALSSFAMQTRLAASLEQLVDAAELLPVSRYIRTRTVLTHRESLLALASRLRELAPVEVAVAARLSKLVWDQASPAYQAGDPGPLFAEVIARSVHVLRDERSEPR